MMHPIRSLDSARPARRRRAAVPRPVPGNHVKLLRDAIGELEAVCRDAARLERRFARELAEVHPTFRDSARNLVHYLALRDRDVRILQERLTGLGLSSLGRTESHVMAALDAVLCVLRKLAGEPATPMAEQPLLTFAGGSALLAEHTEAVLGKRPRERGAHIMVTMPGEAARDYDLVRRALVNGMDLMRVNCAHDDQDAWSRMVVNLRRATRTTRCACRVLMDLGGPKLRTGAIDAVGQIVRWKPRRGDHGEMVEAARIWLTPVEAPHAPATPADARLDVPAKWLRRLREGDQLRLTDLRGRARTLVVAEAAAGGRFATAEKSAWLYEARPVRLRGARGEADGKLLRAVDAVPYMIAPDRRFILLHRGDRLVLTADATPGRSAETDADGRVVRPAHIPCTLPEAFPDVRPRERILFDDGKIEGIVEATTAKELRVRILAAPSDGVKLHPDKGINLPDTRLRLPALTERDLHDLDFVVHHADLVGLSFVRTPDDVEELRRQLELRDGEHLGIVLKIETAAAFDQLPRLLLAAMRSPRVAVMIARGDLAVECGFERLAEVQEELLWFCEAAHVPVIWATQVLENLAKTGVPSRAEITDAAMGERAECVMLNKGPHIVEAVRVLQGILQRMEAHQRKKSARLRRLRLSSIAASA
ncbi:pyruvate kinase [Candidatus Binatia bacterium]|nr:pyruvate kinase [Candidatus Binatia bacterium]